LRQSSRHDRTLKFKSAEATAMKIDDLIAIDVHTHVAVSCRQPADALCQPFEDAANTYFKVGKRLRRGRRPTTGNPRSASWQDEALSVCLHKPNVYIDPSGWSPKYFPAELVSRANGQLKHKMLFGSDFPLIAPDRWIADFKGAGFKPEVHDLILKHNAIRALKLDARTSEPTLAKP
jgi:Amidohydrolase